MKKSTTQDITATLTYFAFFTYAPTADEIYTFLKHPVRKDIFTSILHKMKEKKRIKTVIRGRYTLGEYSISGKNMTKKIEISREKYTLAARYARSLKWVSCIKMIGLSGSVAMLNAQEKDDVDIFIITANNRLWTGRFFAILLAKAMGIHRGFADIQTKNKICLNLFFDAKNMKIPAKKRGEYGAHELLQMKPLVQKDDIYMRLLDVNKWVFDIFPNNQIPLSKEKINQQKNVFFLKKIGDFVESICKYVQITQIRKHYTSELITESQLWFHPRDFQEVILKK